MNFAERETAHWATTLIQSRRTTLPKRLCGPGPDAEQQTAILQAAAAAPDHDQLLPWRLVDIPKLQRARLGTAFEASLLARDSTASEEERAQARDKALRAPWLLLLVVRTGGEPTEIPATERVLSAGAAVQNMLLMATALGLGSSLTSGKALASAPIRQLFALNDDEQAVCFINVGHVGQARKPRARPDIDAYFSVLTEPLEV